MSTITSLSVLSVVILSGHLMAEMNKKSIEGKKVIPDPATCTLESLEGSGLGDVKFSILSEADFQAVNGSEWVQLRGQAYSALSYGSYVKANGTVEDYTSDGNIYHSTSSLPDARGRFLRMENAGTSVNPDLSLKMGQTQEDMFASHDHGMGGAQVPVVDGNPATWHNSAASHGARNFQGQGGNETRAKNVTVNIFVKIRRRCVDSSIQDQIDNNAAAYDAIQCASATFPTGCTDLSEADNAAKSTKAACFKTIIDEWEGGATYGAVTKSVSQSCLSQSVSHAKKILFDLGANRSGDENTWFDYLVQQYPYYYVVNTAVQ